MARPRTPKSKALVSGATMKNAGRFRDRKEPRHTRAIGEPYAGMTPAQKQCWREFVADMPWLHSAHRTLLRLACHFAARLDDEEFGVSAAQALSSILSKLGATPVDETKVTHGDGDSDEEDPAESFFTRPN